MNATSTYAAPSAVAGPSQLARPPTSLRGSARPFGVIIVDDEVLVRDVLVLGLRRQGHASWSAANGQEALDRYRQHSDSIDMILMDVCMPILDGPQALLALQRLYPSVRCCFMSGNCGDYSEEFLQLLSGNAVLRKPFSLTVLARLIEALLSEVAPAALESAAR